MKVRWLDASIRLRITPTELTGLILGQELGQTIEFPGGAAWTVRVLPQCRAADLIWCGDALCVCLREEDVAELAEGDTEGVYFTTGGGRPIRYFVEKDFPCAHPHPEEAADPETERFAPTESYLRRKQTALTERP
jgi:hypothetical protein